VSNAKLKVEQRIRRKRSIRTKLSGTTERPRLCVFKSAKHVYAQVVDDTQGKTLAAASTVTKGEKDGFEGLKPVARAKKVGELIAARCKAAGIELVVFDRNGFKYHGRIKAVADGAREGGLQL
jgi:large subunit ribosomal protein L18